MDATPRKIGDYELIDEIARGGMGVVYRARQLQLNRIVALKMILTGQFASEAEVQRFQTEAEAAAQLDHPGIVPVFEVGQHEGNHFFSMGFVEGDSLAARIADGPLAPRDAAELVRKIADAVQYAHEKGVIHRDLKPANVLLDQDDQPRITDFGLAKQIQSDSDLTASGQILGTPGYMPPEQAVGRLDEVNESADTYAIGAILYALLTGRPPFQADNPLDTLRQVLEREPVSPRTLNAKVPQDLETICLKSLAKDPRGRYATAAALSAELGRFLAGEPILARPIGAPARLWRWCRRNPVIAGLSASVAVLLIAATAAALAMADRERGLRTEAESARDDKDAALRRSEVLRLTAQSSVELVRNPGLALLLAIEATKPGPRLAATNNALVAAVETCRETRCIRSSLPVRSAVFSRDGRFVLTTGWSPFQNHGRAEIWDGASGARLVEMPQPLPITTATLSPDGTRVVFTYRGIRRNQYRSGAIRSYTDRIARVFDTASGEEITALRGHESTVVSASFRADGARILTASADGTARVWDAVTGRELAVIRSHDSGLLMAKCSSDAKLVLTASGGSRTTAADYDQLHEPNAVVDPPMREPPPGIDSADDLVKPGPWRGPRLMIPIVRLFVSVKLWDAETGRLRVEVPERRYQVFALADAALSPSGKQIAIAQSKRGVTVLDATSGDRLYLLEDTENVHWLAFDPGGDRLLTSGYERAMAVWDAKTGVRRRVIGHPGIVAPPEFSSDGTRVLAACSDNATRIWDSATAAENEFGVSNARFRADGAQVVTRGGSTARIWNVAAATRYGTILTGHRAGLVSIAYSPDGRLIATGSDDQTARIWRAATGECIHVLEGLSSEKRRVRDAALGAVHTVEFSRDSSCLLTASSDVLARAEKGGFLGLGAKEEDVAFEPVRIWSVETGEQLLAPGDHETPVESARFDAATELVLVGHSTRWRQHVIRANGQTTFRRKPSRATRVRVIDAASGDTRLELGGHGSVNTALFSPGGRRLLTADTLGDDFADALPTDFAARVWDAASGALIARLEGKRGSIRSAAFSPDGSRVLTNWSDRSARIWDTENGTVLTVLAGHESQVRSVAFSPDGTRALTTGNTTARVWDVTAGRQLQVMRGHRLGIVTGQFNHDGTQIVTASHDKTARVWDAVTGEELITLSGHTRAVTAAVFSPDGQSVATASEDGTAHIWPLDPRPAAIAAKPRELTGDERTRFELDR